MLPVLGAPDPWGPRERVPSEQPLALRGGWRVANCKMSYWLRRFHPSSAQSLRLSGMADKGRGVFVISLALAGLAGPG